MNPFELIQQRLTELQAQERQAFANFNAVLGARRFCESLLKELEDKENKEPDNGER